MTKKSLKCQENTVKCLFKISHTKIESREISQDFWIVVRTQYNTIHNSKKWTEKYCCNLHKKILLHFIKKFFVLFSYRKLYHDYISKSWTHPFVHCIVLRRSAHTTSQPKNGWFFKMKWSPFFLRFSSANAMKKQRFLTKLYYLIYLLLTL